MSASPALALFVRERIQIYRELSKSGIVALVIISVIAGYLAGHPLELPFGWTRFLLTMIGILFLAAGSSALNQFQEQKIDAQMPRTQKRPLPSGKIGPTEAILFCGILIGSGLGVLWVLDSQVFLLGLIALISYNVFYTLWWKQTSPYAAIPGAIPGALPILMGYTAAHGKIFSLGGLYLFAILFYWQMPHFWSLALRFEKDYEKGGIPTLPVKKGTSITLKQISIWTISYILLSGGAPIFLQVDRIYMFISVATSLMILWELKNYLRSQDGKAWLRYFLWINFSLILFLGAAVIDIWSVYLIAWWHSR